MKEEFNLSEKLYYFGEAKTYLDEDVKEFIRLLKDGIDKMPCWRGAVDFAIVDSIKRDIINKLAGEKLK